MRKSIEPYKRFIVIGISIIALGIPFTTSLREEVGSLGTVFIAVGGLFIIIGLRKKRKADEKKTDNES